MRYHEPDLTVRHHEPDDGLTAPREEMRVVDFYPNGTPASRALVEWARAVGFEVVHDTNPDHNTADDDDLLPDGAPGNATLLRHHSAFNSSLV